ncbi:MAG: IS4 family transposase [Planctomycetaceae bacterium]
MCYGILDGIEIKDMDVRLQRRYWRLVREHMKTNPDVAAGPKALFDQNQSFASTQALWRFLANPRVGLPQLVEPLRQVGVRAVGESASGYALLVHDWSKLSFPGHAAKTDQTRLSHKEDIGYELYTSLLIDAADGRALAPMELELLSAAGVHTTSQSACRPRRHHLEQLLPTMEASRTWNVPARMVHVIDREADSQFHFREWHRSGHLFLVRADFTRKVDWRGHLFKLPDLAKRLDRDGFFQDAGELKFHGQLARRSVACVEVALSRPARKRTAQGRVKASGEPLDLRLVISRVLGEQGELVAEWYLLTNVPDEISGATIADWYYWRWRIESYHKLLKSGGQQLEAWQQESASAVAKRLLVAAMACVCVWQLERQSTPEARECQKFLVRLSGRQLKRHKPITTSALLAGLMILLPVTELLEQYTPDELKHIAQTAAPLLFQSD